MVVRFVDSAIAFCAAPPQRFFHNKGKKVRLEEVIQFVFLYPESGDGVAFVPTEELFEVFPLATRGEHVVPVKLPFPYNQLRHVTGVRIYELERGKRRMFCVVPTWDPPSRVFLADARLDMCLLESPFSREELVNEDYLVLTGVERRGLFYNITLVSNHIAAMSESDVDRRVEDVKKKAFSTNSKKGWSN
jgi:hypothetical protein